MLGFGIVFRPGLKLEECSHCKNLTAEQLFLEYASYSCMAANLPVGYKTWDRQPRDWQPKRPMAHKNKSLLITFSEGSSDWHYWSHGPSVFWDVPWAVYNLAIFHYSNFFQNKAVLSSYTSPSGSPNLKLILQWGASNMAFL